MATTEPISTLQPKPVARQLASSVQPGSADESDRTTFNGMPKSLEGSGKDLFNDLLVGELFAPINVSSLCL